MPASEFKVVVFRVGTEEFGVHIDQVVSIERMQPITALPNMPDYVMGVIDLRGVVTPIIDLRRAILRHDVEENDSQRIVVVNTEEKLIGLVVDAATDVLDIPAESIQKPDFVGVHDVPFLLGVAKLDKRLLILLDINKLLRNIASVDKLKEFEISI